MSKKRILKTVIIIFIMMLIIIVNDKINTNTTTYPKSDLTIKMGTKPDEEFKFLNAEELTHIDDSEFVRLEKAIKKKADYVEIKDSVEMWIAEGTEGFKLTDTEDLSISTYNMPLVNVTEATVANIAYVYLFSDGESVGYVMFFITDGKLNYNISLNVADTRGDYLQFLENHKDMSFIAVTDGFTHYFLGEDNNVYNISTGNKVFWFTVEGDCYQALGADKISVSYEKIVNQIEMIQD